MLVTFLIAEKEIKLPLLQLLLVIANFNGENVALTYRLPTDLTKRKREIVVTEMVEVMILKDNRSY